MDDELIERALRGEATAAELAELAAWRSAAPEHEERYRRTERLVSAARGLRPAVDASARRPSAASIIAGARSGRTDRADQAVRVGRRARVHHWGGWAVAAAAVVLMLLSPRGDENAESGPPTEVVTGASELATVKLGDGTVVRLAPSSRLRVVGERAREVTLEGRAYFAVTSAPDQPFRVHTQAGTANVLGTRFELATEEADLRLLVLEGRVSLDASGNSVEVGAGEESGIQDGMATAPAPSARGGEEPAWLGNFLVFQAMPLRDVAREIERLYGATVVVTDSSLAGTTVRAEFTDRSLEDVVDVICRVLSTRCTVEAGLVSIGG